MPLHGLDNPLLQRLADLFIVWLFFLDDDNAASILICLFSDPSELSRHYGVWILSVIGFPPFLVGLFVGASPKIQTRTYSAWSVVR